MLSTQLLDVVFVPLLIAGVESIKPVDGRGYGGVIITSTKEKGIGI